MRIVFQRVCSASVDIVENGARNLAGKISRGAMVLAAVEHADTSEDVAWIANKIANLRVFEDGEGKMNLSLLDVGGNVLLVSQFTLYGSVKKGSRPSFNRSAPAEISEKLYEDLKRELSAIIGKPVQCGVFGAMMEVSLVNDGPVTIIIDSKNREI